MLIVLAMNTFPIQINFSCVIHLTNQQHITLFVRKKVFNAGKTTTLCPNGFLSLTETSFRISHLIRLNSLETFYSNNLTIQVCGIHMSQGGSFTSKQVLSGVETAVIQSAVMFDLLREKISEVDENRNVVSTFLN